MKGRCTASSLSAGPGAHTKRLRSKAYKFKTLETGGPYSLPFEGLAFDFSRPAFTGAALGDQPRTLSVHRANGHQAWVWKYHLDFWLVSEPPLQLSCNRWLVRRMLAQPQTPDRRLLCHRTTHHLHGLSRRPSTRAPCRPKAFSPWSSGYHGGDQFCEQQSNQPFDLEQRSVRWSRPFRYAGGYHHREDDRRGS